MHRVIVIGSVNHDRIWHLENSLRPGGRLRFSTRETHLGGGGFHTGRQLLDLGADVALVTGLMRDEQGLAAMDTLDRMGFDTRHVAMRPGDTMPLEILLEPSGERTILAPSDRRHVALSINEALKGDAAYLNVLLLEEPLVAKLDDIPLVVSQLPLGPATPRPADYIVTSRDDADEEPAGVWRRAVDLAGSRLKMLVLTDGPRSITLYDGVRSIQVEPAQAVRGVSTIGAGDRFSGAFLFSLLSGRDAATAAAEASQIIADWLRGQLPR
ncbi:PfkB family carbohydrate kinase [Rhizobium puerariae]|uniref:PfkB family carbohydrate kinase n=1 Tax=Rhizobium puerariae TaxID=1585791 RepID=A0ABV6ACR3_9HYPH